MRAVGAVLGTSLVFVWLCGRELRTIGRLLACTVCELALLGRERTRSLALERRKLVVTPAVVSVIQMVVSACHDGLSGSLGTCVAGSPGHENRTIVGDFRTKLYPGTCTK
jgi:hypothetical protein